MKNIKNIGKAFGIIILILFAATGCPPCPPYPYENEYFVLKDIDAKNINNAGRNPVIVDNENEIISKNAYGIRVSLDLKLLSNDSIGNVSTNSSFIKNFSLFSKLYAVDPPLCLPPPPILKDTIVSLKIFTVNNFDDEFMADSEVSDLFRIYDSRTRKYISIEEYLENFGFGVYPVSYPQSDKNFGKIIDLYLMKAPEFTGEHSFIIEVLLSDGRTFSSTTSKIILE